MSKFAQDTAESFVNANDGGLEEALVRSNDTMIGQAQQPSTNTGTTGSYTALKAAQDQLTAGITKPTIPGLQERQYEVSRRAEISASQASQQAAEASKMAKDAKGTLIGDLTEQAAGKLAEAGMWAMAGTALTDDPVKGAAFGLVGPVVTSAWKHGGDMVNGVKSTLQSIPQPGPGDLRHMQPTETAWPTSGTTHPAYQSHFVTY